VRALRLWEVTGVVDVVLGLLYVVGLVLLPVLALFGVYCLVGFILIMLGWDPEKKGRRRVEEVGLMAGAVMGAYMGGELVRRHGRWK